MNAKSDCTVVFTAGAEPLQVRIESTVRSLFGRAIEETARAVAAELGAVTGEIRIEDNGALDLVIAARVEAALRSAGCARPVAAAATAPGRSQGSPSSARDAARRRSRLYLPGNQPDLLPNAGLFGADCLVLDLEDSVPPSRKEQARILLRRSLERHRDFFGASELAVRINPLAGPWGLLDLAELSGALPQVVLLPKCESPAEVKDLDLELGRVESTGGAPGGTLVIPIVETARGILAAPAIAAASTRVAALCFGAEDFAADIGARRTPSGTEAFLARQAVVLAARAAGVQPLDSVFSDTEDAAGFEAYCASSRAMGFDGVGVLHPRQVSAANAAFSPTDQELEEARAVIEALEEAERRGSGVASLGGKMIDAPVARRARRIIALAGT